MYAQPANSIGAYNVVHPQAGVAAGAGRGWAAPGYPAGAPGAFPTMQQQQQQPMFRGGFQPLAQGYPYAGPGVAQPQAYPQQMPMWGAPTPYALAGGRGGYPDRGGRGGGMMHPQFRGGYGAPFPGRGRGKKVWHGGTLESQKAWERSTLCCFFLQGLCKFNELCRFSHDDDQKRECQFGANCRVGHAGRAQNSQQGMPQDGMQQPPPMQQSDPSLEQQQNPAA